VDPASSTTGLRRVISLPWLILYELGTTIGAGIYALTVQCAALIGLELARRLLAA
jgi:hypothetical protein